MWFQPKVFEYPVDGAMLATKVGLNLTGCMSGIRAYEGSCGLLLYPKEVDQVNFSLCASAWHIRGSNPRKLSIFLVLSLQLCQLSPALPLAPRSHRHVFARPELQDTGSAGRGWGHGAAAGYARYRPQPQGPAWGVVLVATWP